MRLQGRIGQIKLVSHRADEVGITAVGFADQKSGADKTICAGTRQAYNDFKNYISWVG